MPDPHPWLARFAARHPDKVKTFTPPEIIPSPTAPPIVAEALAQAAPFARPDETLAAAVNRFYPRRKNYGDRYQNGVKPGEAKLAQFREVLRLRGTPPLYAQEGKGHDAIAHVKLFDPCGSWTWYLTEWDGTDEAFGLTCGHEKELGYVSLPELATVRGRLGIGIEIDMHWKPRPLNDCHD